MFFRFLFIFVLLSMLMAFKPNSRVIQDSIRPVSSADSLKLQIELGRLLFYDKLLSRDTTISCATCHKQAFAFADTVALSSGIKNRKPARNTPTLTNIGSNKKFMFDGFMGTLEMQIIVPIEEHNEMDFSLLEATARLKTHKKYNRLARLVFNRQVDPFVITRSIAAFERSFQSYNSKYDRVLAGKEKYTVDEKAGSELFFGRLNCVKCHAGINFSNDMTFNNGLYETYPDEGRFRVTQKDSDLALFKVPTLRNIMLTKPYMHDGSLGDIKRVIAHYQSGGKNHKNKSEFIKGFILTQQEEMQLIAFLNSLTDVSFIKNKKYGPLKR